MTTRRHNPPPRQYATCCGTKPRVQRLLDPTRWNAYCPTCGHDVSTENSTDLVDAWNHAAEMRRKDGKK